MIYDSDLGYRTVWQTILNNPAPYNQHSIEWLFDKVSNYFVEWSQNCSDTAFERLFEQIKTSLEKWCKITDETFISLDPDKRLKVVVIKDESFTLDCDFGLEGIIVVLNEIFLKAYEDNEKLELLLFQILNSSPTEIQQKRLMDLVEVFLQKNIPITPSLILLAYEKRLNAFILKWIEKKLFLRIPLNEEGQTQLHLACRGGKEMLPVVKALLKEGIIAKHQDNLGNTPLHYACEQGIFEVVEELVKYGNASSDAYVSNNMGKIPLQMLGGEADIAIANYLQYHTNLPVSLHAACQTDRIKLINWLMNLCPREISHAKYDPLTAALQAGHSAVAKLIFQQYSTQELHQKKKEKHIYFVMACRSNILIKEIAEKIVNLTLKDIYSVYDKNQFVQLSINFGICDINRHAGRLGSLLHLASATNNTSLAKILFQVNSIEVEAFNQSQKTALHIASKKGHVEIAELLVNKKANVLAKSKKGLTPIDFAMEGGHINLMEFLLNSKNIKFDSSLVKPEMAYKQLSTVKYLYIHLGDQNKYKNWKTIFGLAVEKEISPVVSFCLENNLHTGLPKPFKMWKIIFSSYHKLIIDNKNDPQSNSLDPLTREVVEKITDTLLTQYSNLDLGTQDLATGYTLFHFACKDRNLSLLRKLCEQVPFENLHIYLNHQSKNGSTPLHLALQSQVLPCVHFLLQQKVYTHLRDQNGESAIDLIERLDQKHISDEFENILMDLWHSEDWAHPWKKIENQTYLLQLSCRKRDLKTTLQTIENLSLHELSSFRYKNTNKNYLHMVCEYSWGEVAQKLLNTGISFWNLDNLGRFPLHWACEKGLIEIAKQLIDQAISIDILNTKDINGFTPFYLAAQARCKVIIDILMDKGVNITGIMNLPLSEKIFLKISEKQPMGENELLEMAKRGFEAAAMSIIRNSQIKMTRKKIEELFQLACEKEIYSIVFALGRKSTLIASIKDPIIKSELIHALIRKDEVQTIPIGLMAIETSPLHQALLKGKCEHALEYVQAKLYIEVCDSRKRDPIHLACERGYVDVVENLLYLTSCNRPN